MDVADMLLDKILSWVELQKDGAAFLKEVATVIEEMKEDVNATKVVGSSASVGGAAALAAAGALTLCTGGLAAPFLATAGAVATGAGLVTNMTADIVDIVMSSLTMKEAEKVSEEIQNLEAGIQKLMTTLAKEGKRREQQACADGAIPPGDYVVEKILRAMAKREGLMLNDKIRLCKMVSQRMKSDAFRADIALSILYTAAQGVNLIGKVLIQEIAEDLLIEVAEETGKRVISKGVSRVATSSAVKGASKAATSMATKVAAQAVGNIAGGVVGLIFSIPELVISCKNLDNYETEASQSLRQNAEVIQKAAEAFKKNLDEIQKTFKRLKKIKSCIEKIERCPDEKEALKQFAIKNCKDEYLRQWLRENLESETFSSLVDLFRLVKEKLDMEEQKDHSNTVDITFLAHGAITERLIPAKHVLPLSTVSDVVLHSPWNCKLTVDAAYDIAAGVMKPEHRKFLCDGEPCRIPAEEHRPPRLPNHWNSMKEAVKKGQQIPNIRLSPVGGPKDRAWKRFEVLTGLGPLGKNYIVVPYVIPEKWSSESPRVPFSVVSLALSLVLMFSRFTATVHLTACLGKSSARLKLDMERLERQYSCTIDKTTMTSSCPARRTDSQLLKLVKHIFN